MKAWVAVALLAAIVATSACDRAQPPSISAATEPPPVPVAALQPVTASPPVVAEPVHAWHSTTSGDGGFTARWYTDPDPIVARDPFSVTIELFADDACTTPLVGGVLALDAAMPHHGHGMNVQPKITAVGPGRYRADGMLFHMFGRWELFFDHTTDGQTERAQTTVVLQAVP
ncbi:MAG: hypothetical protein SGJ09_09270 [Phycisphaerae bacterium]|nr:hypothetical protein [Phycisphaerae bacterium]